MGWTIIDVLVWVLSSVVDTGTKANPSHSPSSTVLGLFIMANWAGGIVHAFLLRKGWLRWRAHHEPGAWYAQPDGSSARDPRDQAQLSREQAESVLRPLVVESNVPSAPSVVPLGGASAATPQSSAWQPPQAVDVNRAGVEEFRALGLTLPDAQRIVHARHQLGGFRSKDQLMTAAGLPPHVYLNLQHLLVTTQPVPGGAPDGGLVAGNEPGHGAAAGRRLDL
ncbi:ComEA family DNA-binding protein [Curtobacterium sp. SP.BCo]|uniref:ComEA family DNA-binding protein n=1 Tax=Curtobacterium sp. SP.BCo TaxID=3435229 RepID=UPI003F735F5A